MITHDQMVEANYASVYDAVAALRSMWLQPRGPDSFIAPSIVWVYIDGSRVGDVDVLRTIQPRLVNTVRFYDGPSATSRWGVDNAAGVIHVSTWSAGAPGIPLPDSTRRRPPDSTVARPPDGGHAAPHADFALGERDSHGSPITTHFADAGRQRNAVPSAGSGSGPRLLAVTRPSDSRKR